MLGKRPPISMVVDSKDNIWAYEFCIPDIECKRHTIIIPDFVYGFASIQDIGKVINTGQVDTSNKSPEYIDFLKNIHKIKSEIQNKYDSSVISSGFGIEELIIDGGNKEFTGTLRFIFSGIHQKKLVIQNFLGKDITDMNQTFTFCECEEIDIQGMELGTLKDADRAFADCENLKSLNLSNIEFDSQASMNELAIGCISLESVKLPKINLTNEQSMREAFFGCVKLKNINTDMLHQEHAIDTFDVLFNTFQLNVGLEELDLSNLKLKDASRIGFIAPNSKVTRIKTNEA